MNVDKFKEIELKYQELKTKLERSEITADDLKKQLKKMMMLDEDGNYWMIGGKTGKWYVYNGSEWKEGDPYKLMKRSDGEKTQVLTQNSLEETLHEAKIQGNQNNDEEKKVETKGAVDTIDSSQDFEMCKFCRAKIPAGSGFCTSCGGDQKRNLPPHALQRPKGEMEMLVKSINILSMVFLLGGFGLIIGVLFGASFGIFDILGDLIFQFPRMLQETRGKIQGGLIFAFIGGMGGFVIFSIFATIVSWLYNAVAYLFGGIRFKVKM